MYTEKDIRRFAAKITVCPDTACHMWSCTTDRDGYGVFHAGPARTKAHRAAMAIKLGRVLLPCEIVMHACDTPQCVNPEHLSIGTTAQNQADKATRGRSLHGVRNNKAKLNEADVRQIRILLADSGLSQRVIGHLFLVQRAAIGRIARGTGWTRVAA